MIESISGKSRYRVSPNFPWIVQKQERHRARWIDFRACGSADAASKLVMDMAKDVKGEGGKAK